MKKIIIYIFVIILILFLILQNKEQVQHFIFKGNAAYPDLSHCCVPPDCEDAINNIHPCECTVPCRSGNANNT